MFMWRVMCNCRKQNVKVPVKATPLGKPHPQFERSTFEKKSRDSKLESSNEVLLVNNQGQTSTVSKH